MCGLLPPLRYLRVDGGETRWQVSRPPLDLARRADRRVRELAAGRVPLALGQIAVLVLVSRPYQSPRYTMPDRPPEDDRPPLLTRWSLLMKLGQVAHIGSLLAFFAVTQAVFNIPNSWPYVAALVSLQLGLLVFLDYRDWVRHKVNPKMHSSS